MLITVLMRSSRSLNVSFGTNSSLEISKKAVCKYIVPIVKNVWYK